MSEMYSESISQDMYFTTKEMKRVFSDGNRIQKQMDCEAALAGAEAELDIIPREAAEEIIRKSKVEYVDFVKLMQDLLRTGHPFVPLIHAYKDICEGDSGEYVHWGATTQDMLDTSVTLQLREAYGLILEDTKKLYHILADKAYAYKDTIMAGRSNGQQALPITLGYKIAVWAYEVRDDIERLHAGEKRFFKGEFGGAVGTLASLGDKGLAVQKSFLEKLGLEVPPIAWSSSRAHYAELVSGLAILSGTLARMGTEVYALQKSEIGELEEAQPAGSVGSSTMPHKRNPFRAMEIVTNAKLVRGYAVTMLESLETEHERDPRSASTENKVFEEVFSLVHASLTKAVDLMQNLNVYPQHMRRNLDVLHGLIFSEAVMMAMAAKLGRQTAHEIVHELAMRAFNEERSFRELLLADERAAQAITAEELDEIMRPEKYIGQAPFFAEKCKQDADKFFSKRD